MKRSTQIVRTGIKRKALNPMARYRRSKRTVDGDSAKAIKDENDQLVRDIIRLRDDWCFTCGCLSFDNALQVGHMYRRGIEVLRWNLLNCNAQCPACNSFHEESPGQYHAAFIRKFGADAYGQMETLSLSKHKHTYIELLSIRDQLRTIKSQMKAAA